MALGSVQSSGRRQSKIIKGKEARRRSDEEKGERARSNRRAGARSKESARMSYKEQGERGILHFT